MSVLRNMVRIYNFTHRTFLEYFTALYICRQYDTIESLIDTLFPKILKEEWDVVIQLSFQIKGDELEDGDDKILYYLIEKYNNLKGNAKDNLLSFIIRSLNYMAPSQKLVFIISNECFKWFIETSKNKEKRPKVRETMAELLNITNDYRKIIATELKKCLIENINKNKDIASIELGLDLSICLHGLSFKKESNTDNVRFWSDISKEIYADCKATLLTLKNRYFIVCLHTYWRNDTNIDEFLKLYSVEGLFRDYNFYLYQNTSRVNIAQSLLRSYLNPYNKTFSNDITNKLDCIGQTLFNYTTPLINHKLNNRRLIDIDNRYYNEKQIEDILNRKVPFGVFMLLAIAIESDFEDDHKAIEILKSTSMPYIIYFRDIYLARYITDIDKRDIQKIMDRAGFSIPQQSYIWKWINKDISLVNNSMHQYSNHN